MEIIINEHTTTESLKLKFHEAYPFLKLEFFSGKHSTGQASQKQHQIDSDRPVVKSRDSEQFVIHPDLTVAELEQGIQNRFGTGVQVFRKSGSVWLETVATDDWTIREQNNEAEALSHPIEPDQPTDYQEQD